ncbi:hypothetical protein AAG906_024407 [Vitis piasezkii]
MLPKIISTLKMQCCDHHIRFSPSLKPEAFLGLPTQFKERNHPADHFPSLFMAKIQVIHACSLVLAVITYHDILYTEGRPIKSLDKHEFSSIDSGPGTETGSQGIEHKDGHWAAPPQEPNPGVKNSVAGKKELPPPMLPNYSVGFGDSTAVSKDDFRPTTPGSSPGVGHHSVPTKDDTQPKALRNSPSVRQSVTAYKDDYRPTKPGHSPGVGHSLQKTNAEPNA